MGSDSAPGRRRGPRSDAARNADKLLAAARALVEKSGPEVAFDEIARRAGVGNATLYRHFPTRGDLLVAVYADEVTSLCDRGIALLSAPSPLDALFAWLDAFVVHVATKRALALAATAQPSGDRTELFAQWHDSISTTATGLLTRAQEAAAVGPEITVTDVLALASGAALTATDTEHARELVGYLREGLSTRHRETRRSAGVATRTPRRSSPTG
jgi:AcrR family transcriptional regulator